MLKTSRVHSWWTESIWCLLNMVSEAVSGGGETSPENSESKGQSRNYGHIFNHVIHEQQIPFGSVVTAEVMAKNEKSQTIYFSLKDFLGTELFDTNE